MGGLGLVNPVNQEYEASIKATCPLVKQIAKQAVESPNEKDVAGAQRCARQEKADSARRDQEYATNSLPLKTKRAVEFIKEKGASSWLSKLRYGWEFIDIPTVCVCGDLFDADHAMICMRGSYNIERHNEIRDLETEICKRRVRVLTLRWSQFSKKLRGKCCRGAPTRP